jgi:hypothetical protein
MLRTTAPPPLLPSKDLKEAIAAMFEKRPPNFTGE